MSIHRSTALFALLLATAACGGSGAPTGPSSDARTTVDRGEIVLAAPGESAALNASVDGRAAPAALRLSSERRWLHDVPVLDPAALAEGRIVAAGPGTAELAVSAAGAAPAQVTVRVAP